MRKMVLRARIQAAVEADLLKRENKSLDKLDGKKCESLTGVPKLNDAEWAGTSRSAECTVLFTEGDARAMRHSALRLR